VEVKIGVQNTARELSLESTQTPDEVEAAVSAAFTGKTGVLQLTDEKGRRVMVPTATLAYVEIADAHDRRVGFGA
jgi:hypothetical protein